MLRDLRFSIDVALALGCDNVLCNYIIIIMIITNHVSVPCLVHCLLSLHFDPHRYHLWGLSAHQSDEWEQWGGHVNQNCRGLGSR